LLGYCIQLFSSYDAFVGTMPAHKEKGMSKLPAGQINPANLWGKPMPTLSTRITSRGGKSADSELDEIAEPNDDELAAEEDAYEDESAEDVRETSKKLTRQEVEAVDDDPDDAEEEENEDESDMGPTERKLRRNNSFRAAIGDIEKQDDDDDDELEEKSAANKLNTFKSHSALQSALRENEPKCDEFQFKLPEQPLPHAATFTKSKSMHFNSFRNKKSKRKSSSFQIPNDPRANAKTPKLAHSNMSISSSDLTNLMLLNKILPSLSLTSLNHQSNVELNYKNMKNL
jgi:hypothetical protein